MDYDIISALEILNNIKNNPYGIKYTNHSIIRSGDRNVDFNLICRKICQEKPVGIEKEVNSSTTFLLIYEYNKFKDLAIGIDILNENEILLLTIIDKSVKRRKH